MPRPRHALTWVVAAGVVAVGVAAGVDAVRGGRGAPVREAGVRAAADATVRGPRVPARGALSGVLVLAAGPDCRIRVLDLARLILGRPGPATTCRLWAAPRGGRVAVLRGRTLWLVHLGDPPRLAGRLGVTVSSAAWSADGRLVAWCDQTRRTVVRGLDSGRVRRLRGCYPEIAPGGAVLARWLGSGASRILLNGVRLLGEREVANAFPGGTGPTYVVGHTVAPDGTLVLAVLRAGDGFRYRTALEFWRSRTFGAAVPIRSYGPASGFFGLRLQVGPDGSEVSVTSPEKVTVARPDDLVAFVDLRTGKADEELDRYPYSGLAWSPDGTWLALSTGEEILVYGEDRSDPAYVFPLAASAIAWLTAP